MRFARDNLENHPKGVRYGRPDEDLGALRLDRLAAGGFRLTFFVAQQRTQYIRDQFSGCVFRGLLYRRRRLGDDAPETEPGIDSEAAFRHCPAWVAGEVAVAEIIMCENLRRQLRRCFRLRRGRDRTAAMVENGIAQILQQARIRRARFFRRIDQFIQALDEGIIFGIAAAPFGIALLRPRAEAREQGQAENRYQDISHSDNRDIRTYLIATIE